MATTEAAAAATGTTKPKHSSLDSSCPVDVPYHPALSYPTEQFDAWVREQLFHPQDADAGAPAKRLKTLSLASAAEQQQPNPAKYSNLFVRALLAAVASIPDLAPPPSVLAAADSEPERLGVDAPANLAYTTNGAITYASSLEAAVDLFADLHSDIAPRQLGKLLARAWAHDPQETLRIIFHARSMPLGKGEMQTFYRAAGWLVQEAGAVGQATLLANLAVLADRTIVKPKKKKKEEEGEEADADKMDVDGEEKNKEEKEEEPEEPEEPTMSHGYWKDLLNLLILSVKDKLTPSAVVAKDIYTPSLRSERVKAAAAGKPRDKTRDKAEKARRAALSKEQIDAEMKAKRHEVERARHAAFLARWGDDDNAFHRLLHLTVARIFAQQLEADIRLLREGSDEQKRNISMAGKWAPSLEGLHDKHTFVASSIAEILFPPHHPAVADAHATGSRTTYLRHAREAYRKHYLSPLRAHLAIVERDLSAKTYEKINYGRVPSVAMANYRKLFAKHDSARFIKYLQQVALGKRAISGAALTPASLVARQRAIPWPPASDAPDEPARVERLVLDGQWNSLVESVRASGVLANCLAIVDVSGSMSSPRMPDDTTPMDAAIGFGLLIAALAEEPFRDLMVTFSEKPSLAHVTPTAARVKPGDTWDFYKKVEYIRALPWGMNTDFLAVFEKLLLPLAVKNKVPKEHMVKQLFVFSDMQFDDARGAGRYPRLDKPQEWETVYETMSRVYAEAGYELPQLVFWNLASGGKGKPVTAGMKGAVLMGGMGAGTLRGFLQAGLGEVVDEADPDADNDDDDGESEEEEEEDSEDEEEDLVEVDEEGEEVVHEKKKSEKKKSKSEKKKGEEEEKAKVLVTAATAMRRVLAAKAFAGLRVVEGA